MIYLHNININLHNIIVYLLILCIVSTLFTIQVNLLRQANEKVLFELSLTKICI